MISLKRLRLSGHLNSQDDSSLNFMVDGPTLHARPKLRWNDVVNTDLRRKKDIKIIMARDTMKRCHQAKKKRHN